MKTCTKCKLTKEISDFNWKSKSAGIRSSQCKSCHKAYRDKHYYDNREKRLLQARLRANAQEHKLRGVILEYLTTHHCIDCGESDPIVLEFDHRSDKEFTISHFPHCGGSVQRLLAEIDKCDVRCANCHRRKTAKNHGYYKTLL